MKWLSPRNTRSSTLHYSFVQTTRENGLNPQTYVAFLFEQLEGIDTKDEAALALLLPWNPASQARFANPATLSR